VRLSVVDTKDGAARHRAASGPAIARRPQRPPGRIRLGRLDPLAAAVLVVGLLVTATLAWLAHDGNRRNEARLLRLQVRQTGALLQAVLPTVQTPLASAAEIAATSHGNAAQVRTYLSGYLGTGKPFAGAVLWRLDGATPRPVTLIGAAPALPTTSSRLQQFVAGAAAHRKLQMIGPLTGRPDRVGYAFASAGAAPTYVAYAESPLPPGRRATIEPGQPFGNLRFALYLGDRAGADRLLESNVDLPMSGRTATTRVPFGGATLTLVAGTSTRFGGQLAYSLWWIIALVGTALTVVLALSAQRLVSRRVAAERLTAEVRTLLGEQRTIAESLQRALLPKRLPVLPAMSLTARYVPGPDGVQIGGDWYDVVPLEDGRFFFVVGDVSGRGLEAGSVMASLLFAGRGFATEGHGPAEVLDALTRLLDVERDRHFATVLCGVADVRRHRLTVANAGHLPPLIASRQRTEFVAVPTGPPIGVRKSGRYEATTVPVPPGATVLAYTDGLVERRGETLDTGLGRLIEVASSTGLGGEALVEEIMKTLVSGGADDDTAILGLQWR
jgi:serine phosphatase RsbU (regulator of sigma subunit)